ncbi:hypothetical protein BC937DRAFT_92237 [Endogone sp. FLAS-F59071]|nr:hypothetical protein BC937DRAFT_92237 [Endogone sp. FLAS-F59071]|eukprot:RUS15611.1 hypothetical protein BC937DRAFT_92237 [Endogone sp. FLAS-F59071]
MASTTYFDSPPDFWTIVDYYRFRKQQSGFSGLLDKESGWLKRNLEEIVKNKQGIYDKKQKDKANIRCTRSYAGHFLGGLFTAF